MFEKLIYSIIAVLIITVTPETSQSENMRNIQSDSSEFMMKKFNDGVDFYAMGNEPFWNLELGLNQFIHFKELEGVTINLGSVKGEKAMDANVTRYMAETENGIFTMTLSGQECYDDMSGDTFTYKVIVELNNPGDKNYKKFEGCGRYVPNYKLNRTWILKKIGENDVIDSNYNRGLPSISFDIEKNRFSGSGGCNRIMGYVSAEADRIRFSKVASTKMACDNLDLEKEFLSALENSVNYVVMGNQLMLANPDKVLLVFHDPTMEPRERADEYGEVDYRLNDIWVLESINDLQTDEKNYMKGLPTIEIKIIEMSFMGHGGCNSINGKFESKGDSIKFGPVASTRMMCPGNYESEFLNALSNSESFKIENNRLYLMQDGKILIVFKKVD
jgi:heat shock protein HslJ/uncharacterized membrane protein